MHTVATHLLLLLLLLLLMMMMMLLPLLLRYHFLSRPANVMTFTMDWWLLWQDYGYWYRKLHNTRTGASDFVIYKTPDRKRHRRKYHVNVTLESYNSPVCHISSWRPYSFIKYKKCLFLIDIVLDMDPAAHVEVLALWRLCHWLCVFMHFQVEFQQRHQSRILRLNGYKQRRQYNVCRYNALWESTQSCANVLVSATRHALMFQRHWTPTKTALKQPKNKTRD